MLLSSIDKPAIAAFYDRLSPHFRRLWGPHLHDGLYLSGSETKERAQEQLVEFLAGQARLPRGSRVLDVGCGMGATSVALARDHGCDVTGITLSRVQVEMSRELAREAGVAARFLVMDAEAIELDERFDALWMVGVLGHLPDQARFVSTAPRLLRPGARFVLADWMVAPELDERILEREVEPMLRGMLMPSIHSLPETAGWFREAGFEVRLERDLTAETLRTWDLGVGIVRAPALLRLAAELGRDALELVHAIRRMRRVMRAGYVRYGVVIAELPR